MRKSRGLGARVGVEIGYIEETGQRRAFVFGQQYMTAHLVWFWHHNEMPAGFLRHIDGDNANDRIENLEVLRKPIRVLQPDEGITYAEPPETTAGIYAIVHIATGRKYIGSSVDVAWRWREHQNSLFRNGHHSIALQRAWNKHGKDAFGFRLLMICKLEHLIFYEQRAIDAWLPVFNCSPTAGSQLGYRHTDKTRAKMSASRPKDFSPMTGKHHTEETRRKISVKKTGVKMGKYSAERVRKTAEAMRRSKGVLTDEQVRTIRKMKQEGISTADIARSIGRNYYTVWDVVRGRRFAWVT